MYNLRLSAEQLEFRDTVRDFVVREVKPVALKSERLEASERPLLTAILDQATQMGLRTMAIGEDSGGAAADLLTCCIVIEELATGDVDVAAVLAETVRLSRVIFAPAVRAAQQFLPSFMADDGFHLAFAGGGDTRLGANYHGPPAEQHAAITGSPADKGDFVINGIAEGVRNAPIAKLFAVEAVNDGERQLLLVPAEAPGLSVRV